MTTFAKSIFYGGLLIATMALIHVVLPAALEAYLEAPVFWIDSLFTYLSREAYANSPSMWIAFVGVTSAAISYLYLNESLSDPMHDDDRLTAVMALGGIVGFAILIFLTTPPY